MGNEASIYSKDLFVQSQRLPTCSTSLRCPSEAMNRWPRPGIRFGVHPANQRHRCKASLRSASPFVPNRHAHSLQAPWFRSKLSDSSLLSVRGSDSTKFLQGLVTSDVQRLLTQGSAQTPGRAIPTTKWTAFLEPGGRLRQASMLYPPALPSTNDGEDLEWLIEVESDQVESMVAWLNKFVLRSRLEIRLAEELEPWSIWPVSHASTAAVHQQPQLELAALGNLRDFHSVWLDCRAGGALGYRALSRKRSLGGAQVHSFSSLPEAPLPSYALKVLSCVGLPTHMAPYPVNLPFELNLDKHGAIDFRKGCYVGQELTSRTYHRGVIRKRLVPLLVMDTSSPPVPENLLLEPTFRNTRFELELCDSLRTNPQLYLASSASASPRESQRPVAKFSGPLISCDGDEGVDRLSYGLGLIRVDHPAFSCSDPWPSLKFQVPPDQSQDLDYERFRVRPIKPLWWT